MFTCNKHTLEEVPHLYVLQKNANTHILHFFDSDNLITTMEYSDVDN